MAPEKNPDKLLKQAEKEIILWDKCKRAGSVPSNYISLFSAERNFGISFKVWIL
jgi:hypothetical protein